MTEDLFENLDKLKDDPFGTNTILEYLDDLTLELRCLKDKISLCSDEDFWKIRFGQNFPGKLAEKPKNISIRDWYRTVKLSQDYIVDEKGFIKAIRDHNLEAVIYFMLLGFSLTQEILETLINNMDSNIIKALIIYGGEAWNPLLIKVTDLYFSEFKDLWKIKVPTDDQIFMKFFDFLEKDELIEFVNNWIELGLPRDKLILIVDLAAVHDIDLTILPDIDLNILPDQDAYNIALSYNDGYMLQRIYDKWEIQLPDLDKFLNLIIILDANEAIWFLANNRIYFNEEQVRKMLDSKSSNLIRDTVELYEINPEDWDFMLNVEIFSDDFLEEFIEKGYKYNQEFVNNLYKAKRLDMVKAAALKRVYPDSQLFVDSFDPLEDDYEFMNYLIRRGMLIDKNIMSILVRKYYLSLISFALTKKILPAPEDITLLLESDFDDNLLKIFNGLNDLGYRWTPEQVRILKEKWNF